MTTRELILLLRENDPSGKLEVFIHDDCAVKDADYDISPDWIPKGQKHKPRIVLSVDCYCGYVM